MSNPSQKLPAAGEQWDEEQMELALQRLHKLHMEMRNLRYTVPEMVGSMRTSYPSFEALRTSVSGAAKAAQTQVSEYKQLATNEEMTKIIERAKQSRRDKPLGIAPWESSTDPEWRKEPEENSPAETSTEHN